ncbi:MAG: tRNA pseudouridine(55) synthase TruB [Bacteroidetes bacterium GWF2_49_14]|nr:MAG: tRNA pseudouridine(55) synthase TruB [Bacteroidetes bacterium GWF2_49_14]HBB91092.1 tRNA pseudouridine(55) synthase TruB [Bacteroidales bacterium]
MSTDPDSWLEGQILLFDKPYGWTSFYLVKKVRGTIERTFHLKKLKVGHAGTLDPLATGLMIVAVGKATKRIDELQAGDKEYLATVRIGATTPGFDLEKDVDAVFPYEHVTEDMVREALRGMTGDIDQVPPLFSAKKIEGVRAYDMARRGEEQILEPKRVRIEEIELISFVSPDISLRIKCSRGTYIRSIARDLGIALGSGGHLTQLRRTKSGEYSVEDAQVFEDFQKILS